MARTRDDDGTFDRASMTRVLDQVPTDDILEPNPDEGNYSGPFGHCQYEMPRDFRTEEERREEFGPACVGLC